MSRILRSPLELPSGVEVKLTDSNVQVKGSKGELTLALPANVTVRQDDKQLVVEPSEDDQLPLAGTIRALLGNMVQGVTSGYEKSLELRGVGYRAQMKGKELNLTLGFSHPVDYPVPDGITIETPSNTEVVIKGADKQKVGQVAAEIRAFRPPEPYKGKGVRYKDERVIMKEAKKK
jgi:large subunit ribosomal protein L6